MRRVLWCLCLSLLLGACTTTRAPDGTEVKDPPLVSLQKRIKQTKLLLATVRGAVDASRCTETVKKDCFDTATANTYIGYLDLAQGALEVAGGAPCMVTANCTDAEMQNSAEAIGRAVAYIARVTSNLKR